jgi:hypothetical protein
MDVDPVTASNNRKLRIARLAPLVLQHAGSCPTASRVLQHCTTALAEDISVVARQMRGKGCIGGYGLVITGGVGVQEEYFNALQHELAEIEKRDGLVPVDWSERVVDVALAGARALCKPVVMN